MTSALLPGTERRLVLVENAIRHMESELPRLTRELAEIRQLAGTPDERDMGLTTNEQEAVR